MAYTFDGSNDALSIPNIASVGDYTFAMQFVQVSRGAGGQRPLFYFDNYSATPRNCVGFKVNNNTVGDIATFEAIVGDTGSSTNLFTLTDGQLYHLVVTRSGTSVVCYGDGSSIATPTVGAGTFTMENIYLGAHYYDGAIQEVGNVLLQEFAIYNRVWSAAEIAAHAKDMSPPLISRVGLIRYLPLVREAKEYAAGVTVSLTDAPAVSAHQRVYYPATVPVGKEVITVPLVNPDILFLRRQ